MATNSPLRVQAALFGVFILLFAPATVSADCGSIPYYAPFKMSASLFGDAKGFIFQSLPDGSKNVQFDPLDVVVYEPGQRAIILWNGVEEVLLLSTAIRTSKPVSILEVIPLPSEPEVKLGSFETFERMQALLIEKQMWRVASQGGVAGVSIPARAAEITFHEIMGAHDISVVHVRDPKQFSQWVMGFMKEKAAVNPQIDTRFLEVVQRYLDRGFRWFVFDSIDTTDALHSKQPIQYRFQSDNVYYPLDISTLESGKTQIDLLLVTSQPLTTFPKLRPAAKLGQAVTVTLNELAAVSSEWADFMSQPQMELQPIRIRGKLKSMTTDFTAR